MIDQDFPIVEGVEPVLFIGLGGTGKQTLMHIRRLFLDQYDEGSRVPTEVLDRIGRGRMPHVGFLCFDADPRMQDLDGKAFDQLLNRARFRGDEFHQIELVAARVRDLYARPEQFPEYRPWYDFSLQDYGIPENGCGQTRPWGRLAFFQHYEQIRTRVRDKINELVGAATVRDSQACRVVQVRNKVKIFLVFSVAGGTGAGMFLDFAFLLQDLVKDVGIELPREAIVLLPEAFSEDPREKIFANAYAALTELEHYSLGRDTQTGTDGQRGFPVYWPGEYSGGAAPRRIAAPAFPAVWLVGNRSRGVGQAIEGTVAASKSDLTEMMGEWLFLRSSPDHRIVANQINAYIGGNFIPTNMFGDRRSPFFEVGQQVPAGDLRFSKRFGSIGLSKIFLPKTVMHQRAAYRLLGETIDSILERPALPGNSEELMRQDYFPAIGLRVARSDGGDLTAASALIDRIDGGANATSVLREAEQAVDYDPEQIVAEFGRDLKPRLLDRFRDFRRTQISDDDANPDNHGTFARQIDARRKALEDTIRIGFNEALQAMLRDPGKRFPFAEEFLARAMRGFREALDGAEGTEARIRDAAEDCKNALEDRNAVLDFAMGESSPFVLKSIAKVAIEFERQAILSDLDRQLAKAASAAARYGIAAVEAGVDIQPSLMRQLEELKADLLVVDAEAKRTVVELGGRSSSLLNDELARDMDDYYRTADGGPVDKAAKRRFEGNVYAAGGVLGHLPWMARGDFKGAGRANVAEQLARAARSEMRHVRLNAGNALKIFDAKFPAERDNEYTVAINRVIAHSTVWLQSSIDNGIGTEYQIARAVDNSPADARMTRHTIGADAPPIAAGQFDLPQGDAIYFTQVSAGYSLSMLTRTIEYRDRAYRPYLRGEVQRVRQDQPPENSSLHIERDAAIYTPLVVPAPQEVTARGLAVKLLATALMEGKLIVEADEYGVIRFGYLRSVGMVAANSVKMLIGAYERAILALSDPGAAATRALTEAVAAADTAIDAGPQEVQARLLALHDYYSNDPAAPIRFDEWSRALAAIGADFSRRFAAVPADASLAERTTIHVWAREPVAGAGYRTLA